MGKSKDDGKRKRSSHRDDDDDDDGHRDEDEKKHKKHKSHKSSKRHSEKENGNSKRKRRPAGTPDKKSGKKRKDKGNKNLKIQELSNEDYFSKNNEFAMWLKEEKNIFFSDLSSDKSRALFSEFVEDWNKQELESQYYEGVATAPRTSHKWNIKK